ncbi:MAG: NAD(P)(+) transhydrogenase (Re/Si-specific) subunit beta [Saprospiraceae bacterium]|nr:NAD(P)(+) transhydrogenase (Re/Si-specific) subunit beta [Saprospiraceae bacterium]
MGFSTLIHIVYVLSAVAFIIGFKLSRQTETAQNGRLISGVGMVAAILVTVLDRHVARLDYILLGLLAGATLGVAWIRKMPQEVTYASVALLNALGAAALWLVTYAQFYARPAGQGFTGGLALCVSAAGSAVALAGTLAAWAHLTGRMKPGQFPLFKKWRLGYLACFAVITLSGLVFASDVVAPEAARYFAVFSIAGAALGVALVLPDSMQRLPSTIVLLHSYSAAAACAAGFFLQNALMVVAGALVCSGCVALHQQMSHSGSNESA